MNARATRALPLAAAPIFALCIACSGDDGGSPGEPDATTGNTNDAAANTDSSVTDASAPDAIGTDAIPKGTAIAFDGISGRVQFEDTRAFTAASGFSWEMWFNPANAPTGMTVGRTQNLFGAMDGVSCEDIYLGFGSEFTEARQLTWVIDGLGGCGERDSTPLSFRPSTGFEDGRWYHVVATVDYMNDVAVLYLDGALVATKAYPMPAINRALFVNAGVWFDGTAQAHFDGRIDELRAYSNPITAQTVQAHYNAGVGQFGASNESGLAAGWHFDEGAGNMPLDYGGNMHTGTMLAGASYAPGHVPLP